MQDVIAFYSYYYLFLSDLASIDQPVTSLLTVLAQVKTTVVFNSKFLPLASWAGRYQRFAIYIIIQENTFTP